VTTAAAAAGAGSITDEEPVIDAGELVERYWPRAHRFAAMVTRNDQDAGDVAQEAMERVIRNLGRYSAARGSFDAWLWRIVVNAARDAGRASIRRAALFERLVRFERDHDLDDVETVALDRIGDAELLAAVRSLAARPRTLIALRFGAQLTYAEIAEQLGCTEAAALMATRRALAALRRSLQEKQ
jgi:RNA polymerase sigma-70 factor (ECF subfamily)